VFRLHKHNDTCNISINQLDLQRQHEYCLSLKVHHFDSNNLCVGQEDYVDIFDRCLISDLIDLSFDITTMNA